MNSLKNRWSRRLDNTRLTIEEDLVWNGYMSLPTPPYDRSYRHNYWRMFQDPVVNNRLLTWQGWGSQGHLLKYMSNISSDYYRWGYSPFHEKYCYKGNKDNGME